MLEELSIRNYRIFRELKIDQLRRINLIAGSNNSGKTSLLEAIFLLASGRAEMATSMVMLHVSTWSQAPEGWVTISGSLILHRSWT